MNYKNINIVVLWLMDESGEKFLTGGMERWCRDLAYLCERMDFNVNIYQKSKYNFTAKISDRINIHGIISSLSFTGNWKLVKWLEKNTDVNEPFIFVSQELALSKKIKNSISVNHGIWWDGDFNFFKKIIIKKLHKFLINNVKCTICVDTSYINWCHTELKNRSKWNKKLIYLHNYADTTVFTSSYVLKKSDNTINILFPRRIPGRDIEKHGRGAGLFIKAIEILLSRGLNLNVFFVGRGELENAIKERCDAIGLKGRYKIFESKLDDMPMVYKDADIVVIPSLEHEGTSLSAIESIVSGKKTVVTHIGGLCNIVIEGINGFVSDLSPLSLADTIERAIKNDNNTDENFFERIRDSLSKQKWEKRMTEIITKNLIEI